MQYIAHKYLLILFCSTFILGATFSFAQTQDSCKYFFSYNRITHEVKNDFWSLYQVLEKYSLIEDQRVPVFFLLQKQPSLLEFYFGENEKCNDSFMNFLNKCICDSSAKISVVKYFPPPEIPDTPPLFDKKIFDANIWEIRDSALKALKKAYPGFYIQIYMSGLSRTMKKQLEYLSSGASRTLLSAHNLGAAADFTITLNGITVNPSAHEYNIYHSIEPYRILGKFIVDKGYFWGIPWDPGHAQIMRKTDDILLKYPEFQENGNVIAFYSEIIKKDSIPAKYRAIIELLDKKFNMKEDRIYDESQPWVEDSLLKPIIVDKNFRSKIFQRR